MAKKEAPLSSLQEYLPKDSLEPVLEYLSKYKVHLTVTRGRKSILGDYRHAIGEKNHRISVNGNLNQYSFLITLIHELAHLITFIKFTGRVASHGREWKQVYRDLLTKFLHHDIFPEDIVKALERSLHNLPASSCADDHLTRVLKNYDTSPTGLVMIEQIPEGRLFEIAGGKIFRKGNRLRKRYNCYEVQTGRTYLFSPVYEVMPISQKIQ